MIDLTVLNDKHEEYEKGLERLLQLLEELENLMENKEDE